jgi:hypothetical protein
VKGPLNIAHRTQNRRLITGKVANSSRVTYETPFLTLNIFHATDEIGACHFEACPFFPCVWCAALLVKPNVSYHILTL